MMIGIRRLVWPATLALLAVGLLATAASAEPAKPFTDERFMALQAAGEPVLVDVYASWCPTCRTQGKVLEKLVAEDAAYADIHWLKLDWDAQRERATAMGAFRQSTLILYRGDSEVDRAVAQTDPDEIASFLQQALKP